MTTKRLATLLAVLLGGMSSVALLPRQLGYQPVGVNLALPEHLGEWWGHDEEVTDNERSTLGYDTEFARKRYYFKESSSAQISASIVLAGQDMMTGIHRPERCLNAQGWNVGPDNLRVLDIPNFGPLRTTRLENAKKVRDQDGRMIPVNSICYYWFVGYTSLAATHGERVWLDSRDRMIHGYNQRWAMIMISSEYRKDRDPTGEVERGIDNLLQAFIKQVTPSLLKDSVHPG